MASVSPIQLAFNGGQLGPRMAGRIDQTRYQTGCRTMENFIPTVQGPALKRSGFRFVKRVRDMSKKSRLIPFEYSRAEAYVLEFSDNAIRFLRSSAAVLETAQAISVGTPPTIANPCVYTMNAAHGFTTGDEVYISGSRLAMFNSQFFYVTVTGATTFELYTTGASITSVAESLIAAGTNTVARTYTIRDGVASNSIPWNDTDLNQLQYAQFGDTMYLVHPDYPPHKLVRTSDTSWACTEITFAWPAFRTENTTTTTVYAGTGTGASITVTASASIFTADMVGGYIKIGEIIESSRPQWQPSDTMAAYFSGGGVSVGDDVYYDGRVYRLTDQNGGSTTGELAPVHDYGTEADTARTANQFEWTFLNRGWGYGKITGYTSGTVITVDVTNYGIEFPKSVVGATRATRKWALSAFSDEYGYPAAVAIYEQRLWLAGTTGDPMAVWASRTFRFEDFETIADEADSALEFTISSNKVSPIQWMTGQDQLVIGSQGGEFTASGGPDASITPDNITVRQRSKFGSAANVAPLFIDSAILFVSRAGNRLHELSYDSESPNADRYVAPDMTAYADDILDSGVVQLAYQAAPFRQIWACLNDGRLVAQTYVKDQDVLGWSQFNVATFANITIDSASVESVCVVPHPDGDQDQLWIIAERHTLTQTFRFIEILEKPFVAGDVMEDGFFLDCGSTYSGAATTSIAGFFHLPAGIALQTWSNGISGVVSVSGKGKVTVASTTKAHVGFQMFSRLETMGLEGGAPNGTAQGKRKRAVRLVMRVHNSGGPIYYGQDLDGTLDPWTPEATPYTGDSPSFELPGGYNRDGRIAVSSTDPVPLTLVAAMPEMAVE